MDVSSDAEQFLRAVFAACNSHNSDFVRPSRLLQELQQQLPIELEQTAELEEKLRRLNNALDPTVRDDAPVDVDRLIDVAVPWMEQVTQEFHQSSLVSSTEPNQETNQLKRSLSDSKRNCQDLMEQLEQSEERVLMLEQEIEKFNKECNGLKAKIRRLEEMGEETSQSGFKNGDRRVEDGQREENVEMFEQIVKEKEFLRAENKRSLTLSAELEEQQVALQECAMELEERKEALCHLEADLSKSRLVAKEVNEEMSDLQIALEISKDALREKSKTIATLEEELAERHAEFERVCNDNNESRRASMIQAMDLLNSSGTFADPHLLTHISSVDKSECSLMEVSRAGSIGHEIGKLQGQSPIFDLGHTKAETEMQTDSLICPNCEASVFGSECDEATFQESNNSVGTRSALKTKENDENINPWSSRLVKGIKAVVVMTLAFTLMGGVSLDGHNNDFYPITWSPEFLPEPFFFIRNKAECYW